MGKRHGDIDFSNFDFGGILESPQDDDRADIETAEMRRSVSVYKTMSTHQKLRLLSEKALSDAMPWHLREGAYHIASYGDIDSLTYLRHIARGQRLDYVIIATWCMAQVDADEIDALVRRGIIGRVDYVVGEVFHHHARYMRILDTLERTAARCGGRVLVCRTHMKVMVCFGSEYDCVVESSANLETNPRAEQTCITVDGELADFYKEWLDGLPSLGNDPGGWEPWKRL